MPTSGQQDRYRRFASLPTSERREIMRAVNRGTTVEQRRYAPLAVAVARRQQRFWRYVWLLGPLVGIVQIPFVDLAVVVGNGAASTLVLGLMSWFWYRRARRAERLNEDLTGRRPAKRTSHVPSRVRNEREDPHADRARNTTAPGSPRPPRPRGRKRR